MKKEVTIKVSGMTCGHCENAVKRAILEVDGIEVKLVSKTTGEAVVEVDSDEKLQAAVNAVNETGVYQASV